MYSSIKGAGFALLITEQLLLITFCMKNRDTLIEQSLQNPKRQIVQSCIHNLEGIYIVINTIQALILYIAMNKQAQNHRTISYQY